MLKYHMGVDEIQHPSPNGNPINSRLAVHDVKTGVPGPQVENLGPLNRRRIKLQSHFDHSWDLGDPMVFQSDSHGFHRFPPLDSRLQYPHFDHDSPNRGPRNGC